MAIVFLLGRIAAPEITVESGQGPVRHDYLALEMVWNGVPGSCAERVEGPRGFRLPLHQEKLSPMSRGN